MIPISLYVSIEFIKIFQVWFMSQDRNMYYDKVDKRLQCRALNITEELGQIQYVMSDKTGTLTENQMVFRRCSVYGQDYGGRPVLNTVESSLELVASNLRNDEPNEKKLQMAALAQAAANTGRLRPSRDPTLESQLASSVLKEGASIDDPVFAFFLTMAVCNTVVVNAKPHEDLMDPDGDIVNSRFATEEDASLPHREGSSDSVTGNRYLSEVEEESVSSTGSTPVIAEEKAADDGFEEIELIEFPEIKTGVTQPSEKEEIAVIEKKEDEKENSNNYNGERKEGKGLVCSFCSTSQFRNEFQNILHRPSILSVPLAKLKGMKSPFRRSVDKRRSDSSEVIAPPLHSFYDSESPDELALVEAAREYGVRLLKRRFDDVIVYLRHSTKSVKYKVRKAEKGFRNPSFLRFCTLFHSMLIAKECL